MRSTVTFRMWVVLTVVAVTMPGLAFGQASTATLGGTVSDESRAVLPGATVTATDLTSGRVYEAVSDERGEYRIVNVSPGTYKVQAVLSGFATVVNPNVQLLVGQNAVLQFTLKVASVEETVTVSGAAPLVDTTSSAVAGNVDRRQMENMPLAGRNWLELGLMVKGINSNNMAQDGAGGDRYQAYQLSLDGQEVKQECCIGFGQTKISREAVAEFQIITNMFDITQGHSAGMQVQAITKSGTNSTFGSAFGFFRDDKFNAPDAVAKKVLPYQNQQVGGTTGGPLRRDKLLYFVSYELEREPQTKFLQPLVLPRQSFSFLNTITQHNVLGRVDQNVSQRDHLTYRSSFWSYDSGPFDYGLRNTAGVFQLHPSAATVQWQNGADGLVSWTRVINDKTVQELRGGAVAFNYGSHSAMPITPDVPTLAFPSLRLVTRNFPGKGNKWQWTPAAKYSLNRHMDKHQIVLGGEFTYFGENQWSVQSIGVANFSRDLPLDEFERRFPASAWNDPTKWDLSGLDPLVQNFVLPVMADWSVAQVALRSPSWAVWFGDTWRPSDSLSINYGVRWDVNWNAFTFNEPLCGKDGCHGDDASAILKTPFAPWGEDKPLYQLGIRRLRDVAPRFGFAYTVNDSKDLVIRGGAGKFYSRQDFGHTENFQRNGSRRLNDTFVNDGRPGFLLNPTRNYTAAQIAAGNVPQVANVIDPNFQTPGAYQASIGFQKQINSVTGFEADLTTVREFNIRIWRDPNLFFDPATGYNLDPRVFGRPDPRWDEIDLAQSTGGMHDVRLATALTRRFQNRFQAGATYTLGIKREGDTAGAYWNQLNSIVNNSFNLDDEWARWNDFQRHTVRVNGIVLLPHDVSLSGNYQFGSGNYFFTTISGRPYNKPFYNRLNVGPPITIPAAVLDRFDGPPVIGTGQTGPRNALTGFPLHKVDVRLSKTLRLGGTARLEGIVEVFNLFNHANYGDYVGIANLPTFGQPLQALGNAYVPRTGQIAFRFSF
jgi:hypothetical protein